MIRYPSDTASGIDSMVATSFNPNTLQTFVKGRKCHGQCDHDTLLFPRAMVKGLLADAINKRSLSAFIKTAFKPYDVAVTAALLIAKHYLREQIAIRSDGSDNQWADASQLCQTHLGYGDWFGVVEQEETHLWPEPNGVQLGKTGASSSSGGACNGKDFALMVGILFALDTAGILKPHRQAEVSRLSSNSSARIPTHAALSRLDVGLCYEEWHKYRINPLSPTHFVPDCDTEMPYVFCFKQQVSHVFWHPTFFPFFGITVRLRRTRH